MALVGCDEDGPVQMLGCCGSKGQNGHLHVEGRMAICLERAAWPISCFVG